MESYRVNEYKFLSFRRVCAMLAAKGLRATRTEAALVIAGVLPVDLRIKEMAQRFRGRKLSVNDYLKFLESRMQSQQIEGTMSTQDRENPVEIYSLEYQDGEEHAFDTKVYTDGSKCENGVGAAYVLYIGGKEVHHRKMRLANYCTVFQAELLAINKALKHLWENSEFFVECSVVSDSKSALEALSYLEARSSLQVQTWELAQSVMRRVKLSLHWTKAHVGTVGNERADELARQASGANRHNHGIIHFAPVYDYPSQVESSVMDEKSHFVDLQMADDWGQTAPREGSTSTRPRDVWRIS
ncbi:PREDICTED: uncharacterized protein LOC108560704 isoform X2 [Nicrophorus vespilloides]|nr:PREDICTED: uncharacterized protein LOC108560704 isoform X2 [Nicrophorus vespilloides]